MRLSIAMTAMLMSVSLAACAQTAHTGHSARVPSESDPTMPAPGADPAASTSPIAPPTDATGKTCEASGAQSFVGKHATEATIADARVAAGATGAVRVIKPGQVVTMDFRADRLNVHVDEQRVITRITCG